jgi:hypothetical protein
VTFFKAHANERSVMIVGEWRLSLLLRGEGEEDVCADAVTLEDAFVHERADFGIGVLTGEAGQLHVVRDGDALLLSVFLFK